LSDVPKIKGLAFIEALRWYEKHHGQARLTDAAKALPATYSHYVTAPTQPHLGLLAGTMYPSGMIELIFADLCVGMNREQTTQLAANFAKASIGKTLSGFYATLMRMLASPELIAAHYQKIWRLYQSTGVCEVVMHSPTHHELRIKDWGGHTPFFCQMAMFASRDVLEVIGCKQVTSTVVKCVEQRAPYCGYALRWKA
jgi:hypothetical protein